MCEGLSGTGIIAKEDVHAECKVPAGKIAMTSGGTRLRELVSWAEPKGLTVETSGTHLGPSVAGTFATASHGSRIGFGGFQNSVLGMHLIVGPGEHVWIEPKSAPVLSKAGRDKLAVDGIPPRHIRDDAKFENALIHLGSMGIVNGVALTLADDTPYAEMRAIHPIDGDWLDEIAAGRYGNLSAELGCASDPHFYELTIDPQAPFTNPALHLLYFRSTNPPETAREKCTGSPAEGIVSFAKFLGEGNFEKALLSADKSTQDLFGECGDPATPAEINAGLQYILQSTQSQSGFNHYKELSCFKIPQARFDPNGPGTKSYRWGQLHPDEITGGFPGSLYNASFAVPRRSTREAVEKITAAVKNLPGSFVFTLRFVSSPAGSLAFTRFEQNTVIEIDGLSGLVCNLFANLPRPDPSPTDAAFRALGEVVPQGAKVVRDALDGAGIPYSMHWAKLGGLDAAKVARDFGGNINECDSDLITAWRDTRECLLSPDWQALFRNPEVGRLGLLP
jgi:hypothetical protein